MARGMSSGRCDGKSKTRKGRIKRMFYTRKKYIEKQRKRIKFQESGGKKNKEKSENGGSNKKKSRTKDDIVKM